MNLYKKFLIPFFLLLLSANFSCKKDDLANTEPNCIKERIDKFSKEQSCNDALVSKYTFQGGVVYAFEPGGCGADMTTEIVNTNCVSLGYLGGITGNTKINGEDFSNAVYIKSVWKK